jgi:ArsR family transcriptional regulator, arsenate/arsenite/antimonite-responsive transcriptional repressor
MAGVDGYRALADPTRRQILKLLKDGDLPAGSIADRFEMSWPSVSRHLSVLAAAGLVTAERRGQHVVYALTTPPLADIVAELADIARLDDAPPPKRRKAARQNAGRRGRNE